MPVLPLLCLLASSLADAVGRDKPAFIGLLYCDRLVQGGDITQSRFALKAAHKDTVESSPCWNIDDPFKVSVLPNFVPFKVVSQSREPPTHLSSEVVYRRTLGQSRTAGGLQAVYFCLQSEYLVLGHASGSDLCGHLSMLPDEPSHKVVSHLLAKLDGAVEVSISHSPLWIVNLSTEKGF